MAKESQLLIESLNARHIRMLADNKQKEAMPMLQTILFRSWVAKLERNLTGIFKLKQPSCLVALVKNKILGYVIFYPFNRLGNCWALKTPIILDILINSSNINLPAISAKI